jgi:biopolymer transport protein ExbD
MRNMWQIRSIWIASLTMLVLLLGVHRMALPIRTTERPRGIGIYLTRNCTADDFRDIDDSQDVHLTISQDGRARLNATDIAREEIAPTIELIMSTRQERVLGVHADRNLTYGEVVTLLDEIKKAVPDLVFLNTSQAQIDGAYHMGCISPQDITAEWLYPRH